MAMCEPCTEAYFKWLDYKPSPSIAIHTINTTVSAVQSAQAARANDTYDLIRTQMAGIKANCAAGAHVTA